jgi:urease accessory protein
MRLLTPNCLPAWTTRGCADKLSQPQRRLTRLAVVGICLSLAIRTTITPAMAHVQDGQAQGLVNGLLHPISGLDHVLAMIAVGLWGAQLGAPALWVLPITFPIVMAVGGFLGLVGIPVPGVEIGIALSALLLGMVVAMEAKPNLVLAAVLVAAFAIFHGHAHGTELPPGQSGLMYSIGFVIATGCLHVLGILVGAAHRWPLGRIALRLSGSAVAIAGSMFLWGAIV